MIPRIEHLYAPAEAHDNGLSGIVVPYGELAARIGYQLRIEPGAFAGRMSTVRLTMQHDRNQLLGATGPNGNVHLTDTRKELLISMKYPDTQLGKDARTLVELGALTGFSAHLGILRDSWQGGVRTVHEATLPAIGLVDEPALPGAQITEKFAVQAVTEPVESGHISFAAEALAARDLRGEMLWGEPSVVSMANREAVMFEPDSLDVSNPITLMLGSDYNTSAANTAGNGSLSVQKTNRGVSWRVRNLPRTDNGEKILSLMRAGLITGWRVGYIPIKTRRERVQLHGLDMRLTVVEEGMMCETRLTSDGTGGAGLVARGRGRRRR